MAQVIHNANSTRRVHASQPTHRRARTCSIISTTSSSSFKSILEFPSTSTTVSGLPAKHDACGSFVPNASATASLRFVTSFQYQSYRQPSVAHRGRRSIPLPAKQSSSTSSSDDEGDVSVVTRPVIPSISRTQIPYAQPYPVSTTTSSSAYSLRPDLEPRTDLHPVLASLERKSKLCARRVHCSTCKKPGTDYPRCAKCGEMWCSRECRLHGGKRHMCSSV
ncbi:hypothetical protein BDQ17DRAFT_1343584 [Cyathus striatus]|nr:hypothetical protein BDQ17DRAFT_1343584 [Cyathus striatus]